MNKITFTQINKLVRLSSEPLDNETLEQFHADYFGEFRHYYYHFFYHLVQATKPKIALEIGIDHGHTLAHMAAANPDTLVIGIDKRPGCAANMPSYPNVRLIYDDSLADRTIDEVSKLAGEFGKIGVVFQDSSHYYKASHQEFNIYSRFLDKGAIWCCDDITPSFYNPDNDPPGKGMVQYFDELPGRKKLYGNLHHGSKIGVVLL